MFLGFPHIRFVACSTQLSHPLELKLCLSTKSTKVLHQKLLSYLKKAKPADIYDNHSGLLLSSLKAKEIHIEVFWMAEEFTQMGRKIERPSQVWKVHRLTVGKQRGNEGTGIGGHVGE